MFVFEEGALEILQQKKNFRLMKLFGDVFLFFVYCVWMIVFGVFV